MKSDALTELMEFIRQNKDLSLCKVCGGKGYAEVKFSICDTCSEYCGECIFFPVKDHKKLRRIDDCSYCSGTGYRTWIDDIRKPYPDSGVNK